MKSAIYFLGGIFYLTGLIFVLKYLFELQNKTFMNDYYTLLFPFVSLFLIGLYTGLIKLFKVVNRPRAKVKIGNVSKKLLLLLSIIIFISCSLKFNLNLSLLVVIVTFVGYAMSLIIGFKLINISYIKSSN